MIMDVEPNATLLIRSDAATTLIDSASLRHGTVSGSLSTDQAADSAFHCVVEISSPSDVVS